MTSSISDGLSPASSSAFFRSVDALVGLLPEEALHDLLDLGHPRLTADQDDLVDFRRLEPRIFERLLPICGRPCGAPSRRSLSRSPGPWASASDRRPG